MGFIRDPFFQIASLVVLSTAAMAFGVISYPVTSSTQAQQQRYIVSRPERCSEIKRGGVEYLTTSGRPDPEEIVSRMLSGEAANFDPLIEYLICKTPDGDSMFYRKLEDTDRTHKSWTERQHGSSWIEHQYR